MTEAAATTSSKNEANGADDSSKQTASINWLALGVRYALVLLFLYALIVHTTINRTQSEPTGLYAITPLSKRLRFEQLVFACPSARAIALAPQYDGSFLHERGPGFLSLCAGGMPSLLKNVWGLPGDHIVVRQAGVWRNGRRIPYSASALQVVPQDIVVPAGQIFAATPFPYSYDSRMFGPIVPRADAVGIFTDWRWSAVVVDYDWNHRF